MFGNEIDQLKLIVANADKWRKSSEGDSVQFVSGRFRVGTTEVIVQWEDSQGDWRVDLLPDAIGRPLVGPPVTPPTAR